MRDLADAAAEELQARLAELGHDVIRPAHGCVFRFIERDGARLTDLAARSRLTKQAVGEVVAELERTGYVERAPDPDDGRAKIIRLTDKGEEAQRAAFGVFEEMEARWVERYGEERVAVMRELLEELRSTL